MRFEGIGEAIGREARRLHSLLTIHVEEPVVEENLEHRLALYVTPRRAKGDETAIVAHRDSRIGRQAWALAGCDARWVPRHRPRLRPA